MLHQFLPAWYLHLNSPVKTLTNLRLDWSWSVTKSTIKLKAKLKNIPFSKFVFVSQTKETSRFLLQQFHWLPLDKLVNFLLAGIPLSPCPSLKLCTCRCLVLIGFQFLQQWRLCCALLRVH